MSENHVMDSFSCKSIISDLLKLNNNNICIQFKWETSKNVNDIAIRLQITLMTLQKNVNDIAKECDDYKSITLNINTNNTRNSIVMVPKISTSEQSAKKKKFIFEPKQHVHIQKKYIQIVQAFVRQESIVYVIGEDVAHLILLFFAMPIPMLLRYENQQKMIMYSPVGHWDWFSFESKVLRTYGLDHGIYAMYRLRYKHGYVQAPSWKNCRWDENDVFHVFFIRVKQINSICNGFDDYYRLQHKPYNALFSRYCIQNGIGDSRLNEELKDDTHVNSAFVNFDDDFPCNTRDKKGKIFNTIKKLVADPNIFLRLFRTPKFDKKFFDISEQELQETKQWYALQCPKIYNCGIKKDLAFLILLTVGRKNDFEYVQCLVDDYFRDKVKHIQEEWNVSKWIHNHPHFELLKKIKYKVLNKSTPYELAVNAVSSFCKICCP
eukprot:497729_1